jgi:hypothetical protein
VDTDHDHLNEDIVKVKKEMADIQLDVTEMRTELSKLD